ncbi:hypothetical protein Kpol_1067p26 [Vanderwaltozyma polyspora DSM 70294]|uniref:RAVE complex protein Rav1 C-terminal domain-containing protein n=1 Tax=Vanderwaltozyma polyspora (strain ATCC 22028 / DSM 70294 / BCRC 21397 / CBS 2163 / NBRC 10782 / NRRL Y-8283 / UCD 57-17) TaxID=436907 RepID=A7TNX0_VANPO|nr:uncharacterized protein Kpol_1067p26 [Vanderwaltozyma polyspora DSM 70294]EDO16053.1 hypothetical protein Kpol_1067p26 [Vanderwaltozyma polyspora DSM 70294]
MSLNFLPGRPNDTLQSVCQTLWQNRIIFAYCSGNNLIILSNEFSRLQTVYIDRDCTAVDINGTNGFIAVAFGDQVHIYKPIHQIMKNPKWVLCCKIHHDESKVNSLKWGSGNDIILGSNYLSFWNIHDEYGEYKPILLWNKRQPKPVYLCSISQDSQFVSSMGKFDTSVKLWKRNTISGDQVIFHLSLLPHPEYITTMRWKKLFVNSDSEHPNSNSMTQTLYTLSTDGKLRIWSCHDMEVASIVQHWGTVTMSPDQRFCTVVDSSILNSCFPEGSIYPNGSDEAPDLVIFATPSGECETHALENLSQIPPKPMTQKKLFTKILNRSSFYNDPEFLYFPDLQIYDKDKMNLSFIVHDLKGFVKHSTLDISQLIDKDIQPTAVVEQIFTGHNKSIQKLFRSSDGEAILTISRFSENCVWCPERLSKGVTLWMKNIITTESPVKQAVVHEKGKLVITLLENSKIQAWWCPNKCKELETESAYMMCEYILKSPENLGDPVLMLNTPEPIHSHKRHFIALMYSDGTVKAFEVSEEGGIVEVKSNSLDIKNSDIHRISTIDPVHSGFFSNRPLISLISKKGVVKTYKAIVDSKSKSISWILDHNISSGIENASNIRGSSTGKLCIVDSAGKQLTFWDLNRGVLEYEEKVDEEIKDIDWTSTQFGQSIVSIGFTGYALLYTQLRYDYTNNTPSYLPIEKIDITEHTAHDIGDSVWMKDGTFVVASGNQFYIKDKTLDMGDPFVHHSIGSRKILSNDILHLNSVLNGPLPVYHPQFIIQSLYCNKLQLVKEILLRLFLEIRNINFKSDDIRNLPSDLKVNWNKFLLRHTGAMEENKFADPYPEFNSNVASLLNESLTKTTLPYLTRHQQMTLMTVVEAVEEMSKNESFLDYNGLLFLLGVKLFHSHKATQSSLVMRDVSWALHSDNKEILISTLGSHVNSWKKVREYKLTYWAKEDDLIKTFESVAKFEFSSGDTRDPTKCAIFYLALKKKQILMSLWRMSPGHPEQQKMLKFLGNNFDEPRWKTAALKNAYALLSKHRYMDAACFFLLADSLKDCINVLFKQLDDNDLAIGVCRVYEGDNGPILGEFLTRQFLPEAIKEDDRWMTSFIYWKLRKQGVAIRALVTAPIDLEENFDVVKKEDCVNRSFLVEDPALLVMYYHLRKRNIQYLLGALELESKIEFELILRVCEIYRRMGCNYLALSLVKNWKFIDTTKKPEKIVRSPEKSKAYSGIDTMITEPVTTSRVRPTLFDIFDAKSKGTETTITQETETEPKNIFEGYLPSSSNSQNNLLDEFASPTLSASKSSSTINDSKPRSLLDEFSQDEVPNKPKSLLDDFTIPKPKNLLDDFTAPKPKVNNLLDDFMTDSQSFPIQTNATENSNKFSGNQDTTNSDNEQNQPESSKIRSNDNNPSVITKQPPKPRNLLDDFM